MSIPPKIRSGTASDIPFVIELFREANDFHAALHPDIFRTDYDDAALSAMLTARMEADGYLLLIAEIDNQVCGFAELRVVSALPLAILTPREWLQVDTLVVAGPMKRHGVGRALMKAAEDSATERGISQLQLSVWESNVEARAFYDHLGFHTVRRSLTRAIG